MSDRQHVEDRGLHAASTGRCIGMRPRTGSGPIVEGGDSTMAP